MIVNCVQGKDANRF